MSHHGDLRQRRHVDPGEGLQLTTLLELQQNLFKAVLELILVPHNQTFFLLPLQPLLGVLLREIQPESGQVL